MLSPSRRLPAARVWGDCISISTMPPYWGYPGWFPAGGLVAILFPLVMIVASGVELMAEMEFERALFWLFAFPGLVSLD